MAEDASSSPAEEFSMPGSYVESAEVVVDVSADVKHQSTLPTTNGEATGDMSDSGLNRKLIEAIEKQAELEDNVAQTTAELQAAKERIKVLEQAQEDHRKLIASGILIQKCDSDEQTEALRKRLVDEQGQRISAEGSRKEIEKELEDLTSSLFEEANKMVAIERIENASLKERNEHLATQLKDCEVLLSSHQAQLEELKAVMQKMSTRDDLQISRPGSPNPNNRHAHRYSRDSMKGVKTPLMESFGSPDIPRDESGPGFSAVNFPEPMKDDQPTLPTDFKDIDAVSYSDFLSLLHFPQARPQIQRTASASSLGEKHTKDSQGIRNASITTSRAASPGLERSTTAGTLWTRYSESLSDTKKDREVPLRDTRFLKRALVEDIEPTLRLDQAPELGYLSRRAILNAVVDGNLIVEPMPSHLARYQPERYPCALCGESRFTEHLKRNFRLKTSEKVDTQPYPLCDWCKDRVRSVCTYVAFLKQVKEGLWKSTNESEDMKVWEESVKLRESMFWCRVGHIIDE